MVLNEVDVSIINTTTANQPGWYNGTITEQMLVAGTQAGGKDSCKVHTCMGDMKYRLFNN